MMKLIYKIVTLLLVLSFSACDLSDSIYEKVPSDRFPEDDNQLASLLRTAYSGQRHILDDWGWWLYAQEVSSDVLVFPQRGTDWEDGGKWRVLNRHNWTVDDDPVTRMWSNIYPVITNANMAIDVLSETVPVTKSDSILIAGSIAEAKVVRSFLYYLLIDNYGDVPYVDSFKSAETSPMKNTRASICDELIRELEMSVSRLPESGVDASTRVSKGMAQMLLAKLYLNRKVYAGLSDFVKADMDSVISNLNKVIASGAYVLVDDRLEPFKAKNEGCMENIYTIACDETLDDGMRLGFRTLHTLSQQTFDLTSTPWNGCAVKPDFYQRMFADNDGFDDADDISSVNDEIVDKRAAGFFRGQQYDLAGKELSNDNGKLIFTRDIKADVMEEGGSFSNPDIRFSGYRIAKFEVEEGAQPIMNNDFPVFRLADAYLMRAEATLRGGTGADATADEDLNIIREKAGINDVTADLQAVLDERGRELFLEGHRRSDLIRFGQFTARNWWSGAPDSEIDNGDHRLLFPIPKEQSDVNENLLKDPVPVS